ncbi:hypothetical protein pipiens_017149 [Culex pipiens pipiens]|uniref:Uncharacterized protein n=1 Tax=Culex pipiens pipiens TaxID=38569 RepID=A0ABD1CHW6_CULPP
MNVNNPWSAILSTFDHIPKYQNVRHTGPPKRLQNPPAIASHTGGSQYCNAIESVKKGVLDPGSGKEPKPNPYPANLELYCKNLAILNTILEDVLNSAETLVEQLKVLHVLMKEEIVGRSWSLGRVIEGMRSVCGCMRSELEVRRTIAENIGHSINSVELILHVSLWEQLSSRNDASYFFIEMLEVEFKVPQ